MAKTSGLNARSVSGLICIMQVGQVNTQSAGGRILFELNGDALIAANTGRAFSIDGLKTIAYPWTSSKSNPANPDPAGSNRVFTDETHAKSVIQEIVDRKRSTYSDRDQLRSACGGNAQTAEDYSHRILFELLQNAVDASRLNPIGYKGIGFRSILNITDAPRAHSGHLHVEWGPEIARDVCPFGVGVEPPVLEFPEWRDLGAEEPRIRSLVESREYDTLIVLPLKPGAVDAIREEWTEVTGDSSLLVFLDGVQEVVWSLDQSEAVTWRRQGKEGGIVAIEEQSIGAEQRSECFWRLHPIGKSVVAEPVRGDGAPSGNAAAGRYIHSFFPTEDQNPFPELLIHGRFPLQSSRKHINGEDPDTEERIAEVAQAVCEMASRDPDVGHVFDLLRSAEFPKDHATTPAARIWRKVREALATTSLAGLGGRVLAAVRSCPEQGIGVLPIKWRGHDRIPNWGRFKSSLQRHRHGGLDGLPFLPAGSETDQREKTLIELHPDAPFRTPEELQGLRWAPVEGEEEPRDSVTTPIFLPPQDPPHGPAGIRFRFLDKSFFDDFTGPGCPPGSTEFLNTTLGVRRFEIAKVIETVVLPTLEHGDQPDGLVDFLFRLWGSTDPSSGRPFDPRDSNRRRWAESLRIPCADGSPQLVRNVYASEEWTGSNFLERCFAGQRFFLCAPPRAHLRSARDGRNSIAGLAWGGRPRRFR